jgi:hypothetical protein
MDQWVEQGEEEAGSETGVLGPWPKLLGFHMSCSAMHHCMQIK